MKEMKTLTLPNGVTYEIVDAKARRDGKRHSAPPITQHAFGSVIAVNDSTERPLNNLKLFGKTIQSTFEGIQLLDFSTLKTSPSSAGSVISESGRIVKITNVSQGYEMGYIDVDVTPYVGQTLYLTGKVGSYSTITAPVLKANLIKTDGTETYIDTPSSGYTVLSDDAAISVQFVANNGPAMYTPPKSVTFTEVMLSTVKNAAWEPYTGGVPVSAPSPDYPMNLKSVENPTVTIRGGNLIPASYADGTHKEMNGVTFDVQPDGSVIVNGTATATAYFSFNTTSNKILMPNGWLSTSSGVGVGSGIPQVQNDIYVDGVYINAVQTATKTATRREFYGKVELGASRVKVDAGVTVVSQRIYPMLCAFENPIDFEPPKLTQTMTINRTLPGIGDIRDEIDFERGVYIQRVYIETISEDQITNIDNNYASTAGAIAYVTPTKSMTVDDDNVMVVCDFVLGVTNTTRGTYADAHRCYVAETNPTIIYFRYPVSAGEKTLAEAKADFAGATINYVLAIPIETALTEAELAAFQSLYSNSTTTTILNDFDAEMEVKYSMDTKTYIDNNSGSVSDEQIETAVENYLEENPVDDSTTLVIPTSEFVSMSQEELEQVYDNGVRQILVDKEYTNLVPLSTNKQGAIYYGCGYAQGYRLASDDTLSEQLWACVSGFIPFVYGSTIRIVGSTGPSTNASMYIGLYDDAYNFITVLYIDSVAAGSTGSYVARSDGFYEATVRTSAFTSGTTFNNLKNTSYIRVSLNPCEGQNMIVTLDEEIPEV